MAWIDYKKAHDMTSSWIEECLNIFGTAGNIKRFLVNNMGEWRAELISENILDQ